MGDKLLPGIEDGKDVVGVLGADVAGLKEGLHLPEILALLQQRYRVVLTSKLQSHYQNKFTCFQIRVWKYRSLPPLQRLE